MSRSPNVNAAIKDWFGQFQGFSYNPFQGLQVNFDRLAAGRQWGQKLRKQRWIEIQQFAFTTLYGRNSDMSKLEKWQDLCRDVLIEPVPQSIKQCKKALGSRKVLVNLVNLIDHRLIGVDVIRFKTFREFWEYTNNGRTYPREKAKEDGFISALLRKL